MNPNDRSPDGLDEKIKEFQCLRCTECCKQPGFVYLKSGEAERIAQFLGLDVYDFTDRYCEVIERQKLVLKKYADESCVFLKSDGCLIHETKPVQCRDFPIRWRTLKSLDYCQGIKKLL
ncbi:MAG: YkgJ family cysteine cluster protein [Candidatus Omnitrophica bacterium]|nr:YkgJ family cysteine cluster protein [Candidatus Omnitrophota bacterium]